MDGVRVKMLRCVKGLVWRRRLIYPKNVIKAIKSYNFIAARSDSTFLKTQNESKRRETCLASHDESGPVPDMI